MAEPIGSLRVLLGLDSAQFTEGLKTSQGKLSGFAKSAGVAGAAIGAAIAGTAVALGSAIKGAIDNADELSKASQKIGVSVEELSRLKYAAELSDVSLEGLTGGLKRLSANMAEVASGGTGKAAEAFAALGISVTDANGKLKGGEVVLKEVAGQFGAMQDGAGKTALAMAIFGKSGSDLIPLLNSGADGLAQMAAEADALGLTIDTKTAKSAEAFNDNLTRLKSVGSGVTTQLAAQLLPALESVSNTIVGASKNAQVMNAIGGVLTATFKTLATAAIVLGAGLSNAAIILQGVTKAIAQTIQGDFSGAFETLKGIGKGVANSFVGSVSSIKDLWTRSASAVKASAPATSDMLAAPMMQGASKIKAASDQAAKAAKDANDKIIDAAERAHDSLLNEDEKYLKGWNERRKALDVARKADLISYEQYLDDIERLSIEREARGFTPVKPESVDFFPDAPDVEAFDTALGGLIDRLDEARRAADDVAYSIQDIYYGFKNNDWGTAVAGLLRAVQSVQKAFASGTTADKISALAGVAQGVGGAVGGKVGGFLSGAGSGALAGAQIGSIVPGIGTAVGAAIGGILGGLGSLFGGSSAKKKAKREAEERARQAEAERLARVEAARKELEIRLMELSGDAVGALAKRREYELATMDASLKEQQKAVWAAEDLAEAQAKLAVITATRRDLEIELMQAMGDSAGAIAAQREEYLKGVDEGLRPLQSAVWSVLDANDAVAEARDVAREAYERDAAMFRDSIERFRGIASSLRGYSASISLAEDRTTSLADAARRFARISAAARLGDEVAAGQLESAGEALRSAARSQARNLLEQMRIDAQVRGAANAAADTAERQAGIAEQQLSQLTLQAESLGLIDKGVGGVRDAIVALNEAVRAQTAAQIAANAQVAALTQPKQTAVQDTALLTLADSMSDVAKATQTTADVLQRVTRDGESMVIAA